MDQQDRLAEGRGASGATSMKAMRTPSERKD